MAESFPLAEAEEMVGPGEVEGTRPAKVEARAGYAIWLKFADGSSGIIDLSDVSDKPAFAGWRERVYFESVHINQCGDIEWGDDLQMCSDSLYVELTGCPWEKVWPGLATAKSQ